MPATQDMRAAAVNMLARFGDRDRESAHRPLADERLRWLEYRPRRRPGACLADLDPAARKAAHLLLATGLSPHAYAQAMTIMGLEEVLDRREGWRRGRHSGNFWIVVYGDPGDDAWAWRFEGHHLSVTMAVVGDQVHPAPVFLGANPAAVRYAGRTVVRPLAVEEDMARAVLAAIGPAGRAAAVVADQPPPDIRSGTAARSPDCFAPTGVAGSRLPAAARELLTQLAAVYLDRLPETLAAQEMAQLDPNQLHLAWEGPTEPGMGHYYRLQGPDLLIEYDNTANGANHAHTVLRRPRSEFGGDALAVHLAEGAGEHTGE